LNIFLGKNWFWISYHYGGKLWVFSVFGSMLIFIFRRIVNKSKDKAFSFWVFTEYRKKKGEG
jgi:hypothetical protein